MSQNILQLSWQLVGFPQQTPLWFHSWLLITLQPYHAESLPSCAAFPVYKTRKLLEQKGQVATTHLLLLIFPLPFTKYLETKINVGESALHMHTAHKRMCFTAFCAGIGLCCHLSMWSQVFFTCHLSTWSQVFFTHCFYFLQRQIYLLHYF